VIVGGALLHYVRPVAIAATNAVPRRVREVANELQVRVGIVLSRNGFGWFGVVQSTTGLREGEMFDTGERADVSGERNVRQRCIRSNVTDVHVW
jgi:hypothetical protein